MSGEMFCVDGNYAFRSLYANSNLVNQEGPFESLYQMGNKYAALINDSVLNGNLERVDALVTEYTAKMVEDYKRQGAKGNRANQEAIIKAMRHFLPGRFSATSGLTLVADPKDPTEILACVSFKSTEFLKQTACDASVKSYLEKLKQLQVLGTKILAWRKKVLEATAPYREQVKYLKDSIEVARMEGRRIRAESLLLELREAEEYPLLIEVFLMDLPPKFYDNILNLTKDNDAYAHAILISAAIQHKMDKIKDETGLSSVKLEYFSMHGKLPDGKASAGMKDKMREWRMLYNNRKTITDPLDEAGDEAENQLIRGLFPALQTEATEALLGELDEDFDRLDEGEQESYLEWVQQIDDPKKFYYLYKLALSNKIEKIEDHMFNEDKMAEMAGELSQLLKEMQEAKNSYLSVCPFKDDGKYAAGNDHFFVFYPIEFSNRTKIYINDLEGKEIDVFDF